MVPFRRVVKLPRRHMFGAATVAILLGSAITLLTFSPSGAKPASGATSTTTTTIPVSSTPPSYEGYPVGLPSGPVSSASDCPSNPSWSEPLPDGATVSAPFLATSAGHNGDTTLSDSSTTTTISVAGRCEYTLSLPAGDPTNYVYYGTINEAIDEVYYTSTWDSSGDGCYSEQEIGNFDVAFAKQAINSGTCNTDSSGIWSSGQVTNGTYQNGNVFFNGTFNQWGQSTVLGYVFYGTFMRCLQDPTGQHVYYFCGYGQYGPYF